MKVLGITGMSANPLQNPATIIVVAAMAKDVRVLADLTKLVPDVIVEGSRDLRFGLRRGIPLASMATLEGLGGDKNA